MRILIIKKTKTQIPLKPKQNPFNQLHFCLKPETRIPNKPSTSQNLDPESWTLNPDPKP